MCELLTHGSPSKFSVFDHTLVVKSSTEHVEFALDFIGRWHRRPQGLQHRRVSFGPVLSAHCSHRIVLVRTQCLCLCFGLACYCALTIEKSVPPVFMLRTMAAFSPVQDLILVDRIWNENANRVTHLLFTISCTVLPYWEAEGKRNAASKPKL